MPVHEGVDPIEQRSFLLASCHHGLAQLLHKDKDLQGALEHYNKAIEYAGEWPQMSPCVALRMRGDVLQHAV